MQTSYILLFFEISYPAGLPHSPDLLRYRAFAVVHYSCTLDALHLRQMRQLQNLGTTLFDLSEFRFLLPNPRYTQRPQTGHAVDNGSS
jgi:hypothetical protein